MTTLNKPRRVTVQINGRKVGTLTDSPQHTLAFAYDTEWLRSGFSISPLSLPLREGVFIAKREPLEGMFGVFADSTPDGWGRLVTDRMLRRHGIDPNAISQLTRLSIVGRSGMGALEYQPETMLETTTETNDLDAMAEECARLAETDFSPDIDRLFALGGSSGGARPKILTNINGEEWIIKFPSSVDGMDIGEKEYQLSLLAGECGVTMPPTRLFPSKRCPGYFGVRRFDRPADGRKMHMVSASGLLETSHRLANLDYGLLMRLTVRVTGSVGECERLYRLMCFNVFIGNRDDHGKNFAYLYDDGKWVLSPAYDLTENPGINGEHTTAVGRKGKGITVEDLIEVGVRAGIPSSTCRSVAIEIQDRVRAHGIEPKD